LGAGCRRFKSSRPDQPSVALLDAFHSHILITFSLMK
jgi:hypothetical protein